MCLPISGEDNITMQKSMTGKDVKWIGIGDFNTQHNQYTHYFNGYFDGGVRLITLLSGHPFFERIGPKGHIEQLIIDSTVGYIDGSGGFAEVNDGIICASKLQGTVDNADSSAPLEGAERYVGGFVGVNNGILLACYHIGEIKAKCNIGGLIGKNTGAVLGSYTVGKITPVGDYTIGGIAAHTVKSTTTINGLVIGDHQLSGCFYNKDFVTPVYKNCCTPDESIGLTTFDMQREYFVGKRASADNTEADYIGYENSLNYGIWKWAKQMKSQLPPQQEEHLYQRYYVYHPSTYPWVY